MTAYSLGTVLAALLLAPLLAGRAPDPVGLPELLREGWGVGAFPVSAPRGPKRIHPESLGVKTDAQHVLVRDVRSGVTLLEYGHGLPKRTASITKLLSALVLVQLPSWQPETMVTVEQKDVRVGGRWYTPFGALLTRRDALEVMLVASGNNETMALVRTSGVSEQVFVQSMNEMAKKIGMTRSTFADPVGLSDENKAPVEDVVLLLNTALQHPELVPFMHQEFARITAGEVPYVWPSTDALLGGFLNEDPYAVVGGKTGSLDGGYSLAVRVERAGHAVDIIVLEASTPTARFSDAKALAVWAFDTFAW